MLLTNITAQNGDTEGGAPVAILEVQATGLPVISSYHADIPEVVVDGKSALLAPERDVETLAKHLWYLVEHPDVWGAMGRAGREHVEQEYGCDGAGWEVGRDLRCIMRGETEWTMKSQECDYFKYQDSWSVEW